MSIELKYLYLCKDGVWRQTNDAGKTHIESFKGYKTEFKLNPNYDDKEIKNS